MSGCGAVGSARALGAWGRGFKSLHPDHCGRIAQLGEHLPYKQGVIGSSPIATTIFKKLNIVEGYPSGQRGQTVNLLAVAFDGSNPSPSTIEKKDREVFFIFLLQIS